MMVLVGLINLSPRRIAVEINTAQRDVWGGVELVDWGWGGQSWTRGHKAAGAAGQESVEDVVAKKTGKESNHGSTRKDGMSLFLCLEGGEIFFPNSFSM